MIWNQRNQIRQRIPSCNTDQLAQAAAEMLNEFVAALPPPNAAPQRSTVRWKRPPSGMFKLNFDGAIFKQENKSGVGVAIRDCNGLVIASLTQLLPQAYEVVEIEAIAACHALKFGLKVGINEAVLEGDCLAIIQALKDGGSSVASVKPLILDALGFSCSFTKLLYSHTKKDGNKLSHNLVRHSINVNDYVAWMEDIPPPFFFIVQANITNLHLH